ncbi:MAG TPA: nitroreductase family deazaflavin-dependent oxidoreductase [Actinomycetota bacterium]|nr:nitroreductase family deazaflavin-dependent oxidoreductase [Actinomycetota bacterium]
MGDEQRFPRAASWFASRRWGMWISKNLYTPLDKLVYRLTRGRRGLSPATTVLLLTTTGRKSGLPREVPVLYLKDGANVWVMASNYGAERHPAWSSNLLANPDATIRIARTERPVRARLASADEKKALWPRLVELYPAWEAYRGWSDRDFRLFCLEPRDA